MTTDRPQRVDAMFLSFEGVEAVGKSTAMRIAGDILNDRGVSWVGTREPGGTPVAEALRGIVLGDHQEPLADLTELLLMFAARCQSMQEIIQPALAAGDWVLCDRFTDATLAYQGYGRGCELGTIEKLAHWVHGDRWPDKTFLLEADVDVVAARMADRADGPDRIEKQSDTFFDRVAEGYRTLAANAPGRFVRIDTSGSVDTLRQQLEGHIDQLLSGDKSLNKTMIRQ